MKRYGILILCVLIVGCAVSGRSSGVIQTSENQYLITIETEYGLPEAQKLAHQEASEKCISNGGSVQTTKTEESRGTGMYTETAIYSLHFKCI